MDAADLGIRTNAGRHSLSPVPDLSGPSLVQARMDLSFTQTIATAMVFAPGRRPYAPGRRDHPGYWCNMEARPDRTPQPGPRLLWEVQHIRRLAGRTYSMNRHGVCGDCTSRGRGVMGRESRYSPAARGRAGAGRKIRPTPPDFRPSSPSRPSAAKSPRLTRPPGNRLASPGWGWGWPGRSRSRRRGNTRPSGRKRAAPRAIPPRVQTPPGTTPGPWPWFRSVRGERRVLPECLKTR